MEISRWRKPPVYRECEFKPWKGAGNGAPPLFRRPCQGSLHLCVVTGGLHHRLLWVLSRSDVSAWFVYYWLIISVPPSLRGGERRGLGRRPEALGKSWFVLSLRTSPLRAAGINGFSYSAVCYPRKAPKYSWLYFLLAI